MSQPPPDPATPSSTAPLTPEDPALIQSLRQQGPGRLVFGRFRLLRELGAGGMAVVWLALDERLGLEVALKFLPGLIATDPEALHDLRREITRGLRLTHSGIVRVYDLHEDSNEGRAAIAMEYVDGSNLHDEKGRQPQRCFNVAEPLLSWTRTLCDVLTYVHEDAKVIHRDLKPRNLMLTATGRLKVADFGIAATLADSHSRVTQHGSSGTPAYMSPQQAQGRRPNVADDIYAVGATLYELLTSKPPFFRGSMSVILHQLCFEDVPTIEARRAELEIEGLPPVPLHWAETIAACLSKDPTARPASIREVARMLRLNSSAEVADSNNSSRELPEPSLPDTTAHLPEDSGPSLAVVPPPPPEPLPDEDSLTVPVVVSNERDARRFKAWGWFAVALALVLIVFLAVWNHSIHRIAQRLSTRPEARSSPRPAAAAIPSIKSGAVGSTSQPQQKVSPSGSDDQSDQKLALTFYQNGQDSLHTGNLESALASFEKSLARNPTYAPGYLGRGSARTRKGDLDGALSDLNKAIQLNPKYAEAYGVRASIREKQPDLDAALIDYTKAIELNPEDAGTYVYRGAVQERKGDIGAAFDDYTKAIELDPNNIKAYKNRGMLQLQKDYYRQTAIADFSKAVELEPNNVSNYINRGLAEDQKGDSEAALADYNKAIELNPNDSIAYSNRGWTFRRLGKLDAAIADQDKAISLDPQNSGARLTRGFLMAQKGEWNKAHTDFNEVCLRGGGHRGYAAIMRSIASERSGAKAMSESELTEAFIKDWVTTSDEWAFKIASFLNGKISEKELFTAATADGKANAVRACRVFCYAGYAHLAAGELLKAKDYFSKCLVQKPYVNEYWLAEAELARLK